MFYLKYRPQKFSELFGLENLTTVLKNQLKKGQVGHAYLFYGPRGTGKTTMARLLARAVNCGNLRDGEPCNECTNCRAAQSGRFLDIIEIDAASHGLVDDIRDLRDKINLAPTVGRFKVYIIDEAQMLLVSAANALLKTLEEPPPHALFVLCTTEPQKITETIKSRCQRFEFKRAGTEDLLRKLKFIASQEGVTVEEKDLRQIVRQAQGGFRDAETLLEQFLVGEQRPEDLLRVTVGSAAIFLKLLAQEEPKEALLFLKKLYEGGQNLNEFVRETLYYLRDLLLLHAGLLEEIGNRSEAELVEMNTFITQYDRKSLLSLMERLEKAGQQLRWSPLPQLPLELVVWEWMESNTNNLGDGRRKTEDGGQKTEERRPEAKDRKQTTTNEGMWLGILQAVKPLNHSLAALLRSAKPVSFANDKVEIEVFYPFHLERLQEKRNCELLERAVAEVLGRRVKVECRLADGKSKI